MRSQRDIVIQELTERHEERGQGFLVLGVLCGNFKEFGGDLMCSWNFTGDEWS